MSRSTVDKPLIEKGEIIHLIHLFVAYFQAYSW